MHGVVLVCVAADRVLCIDKRVGANAVMTVAVRVAEEALEDTTAVTVAVGIALAWAARHAVAGNEPAMGKIGVQLCRKGARRAGSEPRPATPRVGRPSLTQLGKQDQDVQHEEADEERLRGVGVDEVEGLHLPRFFFPTKFRVVQFVGGAVPSNGKGRGATGCCGELCNSNGAWQ